MARQQETLEFTLEAGRVLLANGGEIFRVQETMQRIAKSYGAQISMYMCLRRRSCSPR